MQPMIVALTHRHDIIVSQTSVQHATLVSTHHAAVSARVALWILQAKNTLHKFWLPTMPHLWRPTMQLIVENAPVVCTKTCIPIVLQFTLKGPCSTFLSNDGMIYQSSLPL
uniref:Uncharacterized protein n=1 Tax=Rhipicephalus microplus TaxID=6941 RepID=A0A6G5AI88_RHIMP